MRSCIMTETQVNEVKMLLCALALWGPLRRTYEFESNQNIILRKTALSSHADCMADGTVPGNVHANASLLGFLQPLILHIPPVQLCATISLPYVLFLFCLFLPQEAELQFYYLYELCVCVCCRIQFWFAMEQMMYASLEETQKYACWNANVQKLRNEHKQ